MNIYLITKGWSNSTCHIVTNLMKANWRILENRLFYIKTAFQGNKQEWEKLIEWWWMRVETKEVECWSKTQKDYRTFLGLGIDLLGRKWKHEHITQKETIYSFCFIANLLTPKYISCLSHCTLGLSSSYQRPVILPRFFDLHNLIKPPIPLLWL